MLENTGLSATSWEKDAVPGEGLQISQGVQKVNCICGDLLGVTVCPSEEGAANLQVNHC